MNKWSLLWCIVLCENMMIWFTREQKYIIITIVPNDFLFVTSWMFITLHGLLDSNVMMLVMIFCYNSIFLRLLEMIWQFLYPSDEESYKLVRFLVERLSKVSYEGKKASTTSAEKLYPGTSKTFACCCICILKLPTGYSYFFIVKCVLK